MKRNIRILFIVIVFLLVLFILTNYVLSEETDSDLDGIPDSSDKYPFDYDNDGMPDIWEKRNGLRYDSNDAEGDLDNDGVKNIDEYKQGTNPLISDKTKETAEQPMVLAPVEKTMARSLIWVVTAFFLFLILIFVLYRAHIFRIFKFMHHVSRKHFEKEKVMGHGLGRLPPRYMPKRRIGQYPQKVFVQRPIAKKEVSKPLFRKVAKTGKIQEGRENLPERSMKGDYIPKPSGRKETTAEGIKREGDVFGRLSERIDEHKKGKI